MTDSPQRRARRMQEMVGELGRVKAHVNRRDELVYKISCQAAARREVGPLNGTTYRSGQDNGYDAALDRWVLHAEYAHHGYDAPCMSRLDEAKARNAERKGAKQAEWDAIFGGGS